MCGTYKWNLNKFLDISVSEIGTIALEVSFLDDWKAYPVKETLAATSTQ